LQLLERFEIGKRNAEAGWKFFARGGANAGATS